MEYTIFSQLNDSVPRGDDDFQSMTFGLQYTAELDYEGYEVTTQAGVIANRRWFRHGGTEKGISIFARVYAGYE
jgi:hypothetical protein